MYLPHVIGGVLRREPLHDKLRFVTDGVAAARVGLCAGSRWRVGITVEISGLQTATAPKLPGEKLPVAGSSRKSNWMRRGGVNS